MSRGKVCDRCGATLRFLRLDTGKSIPVNPLPDRRGNVAARPVHTRHGRQWIDAHVISKAKPLRVGWTLFVPHAADCREPTTSKPKPEPEPTLLDLMED